MLLEGAGNKRESHTGWIEAGPHSSVAFQTQELPQSSHPMAPGSWLGFGFLPFHFSNSISSMADRGSSCPAILGNWWGEDRQFSGDLAPALGWGRAAQADVDSSLWREDPGGELTETPQKLIPGSDCLLFHPGWSSFKNGLGNCRSCIFQGMALGVSYASNNTIAQRWKNVLLPRL